VLSILRSFETAGRPKIRADVPAAPTPEIVRKNRAKNNDPPAAFPDENRLKNGLKMASRHARIPRRAAALAGGRSAGVFASAGRLS
jgi:hypothetical protein